jgi:hypothetical protein
VLFCPLLRWLKPLPRHRHMHSHDNENNVSSCSYIAFRIPPASARVRPRKKEIIINIIIITEKLELKLKLELRLELGQAVGGGSECCKWLSVQPSRHGEFFFHNNAFVQFLSGQMPKKFLRFILHGLNHRQENRRLVGHFYDMKNRFWAVGCGLGWAVE